MPNPRTSVRSPETLIGVTCSYTQTGYAVAFTPQVVPAFCRLPAGSRDFPAKVVSRGASLPWSRSILVLPRWSTVGRCEVGASARLPLPLFEQLRINFVLSGRLPPASFERVQGEQVNLVERQSPSTPRPPLVNQRVNRPKGVPATL
jgi:hypothetical protein